MVLMMLVLVVAVEDLQVTSRVEILLLLLLLVRSGETIHLLAEEAMDESADVDDVLSLCTTLGLLLLLLLEDCTLLLFFSVEA